MIRTAWVGIVTLIATLGFSLRVVIPSLLRIERGRKRRCGRTARGWSRTILWASGAKVRVTGLENLDPDDAHILVSNHQSWFDVFALSAYLPGEFRFVAKEELARVPIFGRAWKGCGHISVDRSDRGAAIRSLEEARRRIIDEHLQIVMFPEGTRSKDGSLQRFKKGAFVLALQVGVPIIPIAVSGSREIMAKGSWRVRPGTIEVHIGPPISLDGRSFKDRDELTTIGRAAVDRLKSDADAARAVRTGSRP